MQTLGFSDNSSSYAKLGAGGEAMALASNAATAAAKEAASGAWLEEVQNDRLPRVTAPGMPHGVFGPWQENGGIPAPQDMPECVEGELHPAAKMGN